MFEFFRVWLLVVCSATAVVGVAGVLLAGSPLLGRLFDRAFWSSRPDPLTRNFQAWTYSVTFAVMAGWGFCLAMVVANEFSTRQAWVWWMIAASVALWFLLDTGRSLFHRVYANAVGNFLFLLLIALPLMGTFGEFH